MLINQKIRLLKQQKGLSKNEIARKISKSAIVYDNIKHGYTRVNLFKLKQLASIFDENLLSLCKGHNKNIINTMGNNNTGTQNNQNFCSLFLCPCPCTKNSQLECNLAKQMLINLQQSSEIKLLKQLNELLMEKIERNQVANNLPLFKPQ